LVISRPFIFKLLKAIYNPRKKEGNTITPMPAGIETTKHSHRNSHFVIIPLCSGIGDPAYKAGLPRNTPVRVVNELNE
jgi:hypothetical protein